MKYFGYTRNKKIWAFSVTLGCFTYHSDESK